MHLEIPQQLNCPICISIFKIPITTECGHSFCRSCLINSSKQKKICPMCRQQFQSSPQKLKQDDALSHILQDLVSHSLQQKKKQDTSFQTKGQPMLLIDVKTNQLLLPYNKISVTFQLQNPIILNKRQKVVARQQYPFNSTLLHQNRIWCYFTLNVYECTLQGKSFCLIDDDTVQSGFSQMEEQFFFRTCKAKQILQTSNVNPRQFQQFIEKIKQIKDNQIINKLYKQVDHNVFVHGNDPLAMIYSIFGLIDIDDIQKYSVLTLFDQEKRMGVIRNIIKNLNHDVSFNVTGFIKIKKQSSFNYSTITFFAILFFIIYMVNKGEIGQF